MALTKVTKTGNISIDGQLTVNGSEKSFNVDASGRVVGFPAEGSSLGYGTIKRYGTTNLFPSINSSSNGWYVLTSSSLDDGSYTFHIKTAAHSSVIFTVGTGYAASGTENLQILSHTSNANSTYLNIIGVRVTNGGNIEIRLDAGTPTYFSMTVYATGGEASNNIPLVDTLEKQTGSPTVRDEVCPLSHATSRVNKLLIPNQPRVFANGNISNWTTGTANQVYTAWQTTGANGSYAVGISYDAATGRFTVPVAGTYYIHSTKYIRLGPSYPSVASRLNIRKNGGVFTRQHTHSNQDIPDISISIEALIPMSAGDYFDVIEDYTVSHYRGNGHTWLHAYLVC